MSVYLVSICEITNFSEALSEYADVSAKLIEENGGPLCCEGANQQSSGRKLVGWKNGYHSEVSKQRMYR